jgi:hypothetical protein
MIFSIPTFPIPTIFLLYKLKRLIFLYNEINFLPPTLLLSGAHASRAQSNRLAEPTTKRTSEREETTAAIAVLTRTSGHDETECVAVQVQGVQ